MEKRIGNYTFYTDGRIFSHIKGRFLEGGTNHKGYNSVTINGELKGRHKWIALAFIPNPQNLPEVNHKDEDKSNNCVENLEWCTAEYNCNYGTRNERMIKAQLNRKDCSKPVGQYTLDGKLVKVWPSTREVERSLKIDNASISRTCMNKQKSAGGFKWSYIEL